MTMRKLFSILAFSNLLFLTATAQEGYYRYEDARQLWRQTDNAAGLSLDTIRNRGYALFEFAHRDGDYRRVQEGGQSNQLTFKTERYQTIAGVLVGYGRFHFNMDHTKDRAWCDVMRPYNSNPFMPGSSVRGAYDTQLFDFTAAIGTIKLRGLTAGMRLDYKVADLSRLRDPRSRSQLLDYKLTPSLTYSMGSHTLGLDGSYRRRKEKIGNVTTVQEDPNLSYYLMTGMEEATGSVGSYKGFGREWVDHRFGANLNYQFHQGAFNTLNTFGIERGSEDVLEDEKHEPGHYTSYEYRFSSANRLRSNRMLHELNIKLKYNEGFADEYKQQRIATKDPQTGLTSYAHETLIAYKKRYQVKVFAANLNYKAHFIESNKERAYAGAVLQWNKARNKHLLPTSTLEYGGMLLMAEGGLSIARRLWIDAKAGRFFSQNTSICLADPTTDYAVGVLLPDMQYYEASYWRGHLQLTFEVPLKIKGTTTNWFVRAFGDYLSTNNSLNSKCVGVSIGLFN